MTFWITEDNENEESKMIIRHEVITPQKAGLLLDKNTENRRVTSNHVLFLSKQMASGDWLDNGETIKISKDGILLDGQHRLNAVIHSGVTVEMLVVYNLNASTFGTIDTGRKRSAADILYKHKKKNHVHLASTAKMIIYFRTVGSKNEDFNSRYVTNNQVAEMSLNNLVLQSSVSKCSGLKTVKIILTPSISAFLHYIFSGYDAKIAEDFFDILDKGTSERDCPVYQLREHLNRNKMQNIKSTQQQKIMWVTKYFKMYIENKRTSRFMNRYDEDELSLFLKRCDRKAAIKFEN